MSKIGDEIIIGGIEYRCIITEDQIKNKIRLMAEQICQKHTGKDPPVVVCTAMGGLYLGVELSKCLDDLNFDHEIDTLCVKKYAQDGKPGNITLVNSLTIDPCGRNLIIIEDIVDDGGTLNFLSSELERRYGSSLSIEWLALIVKQGHKFKEEINYFAWIGDFGWLVGNGMDSRVSKYCLCRGLRNIYEKK